VQRGLVYLAGPAANVLIAVGMWGFSYDALPSNVLHGIAMANIALAVFNLLPVFPLDGARLLQLFLGNRLGIKRANRILLKLTTPVAGVLLALGLVQAILYPWNFSLICAGLYLWWQGKRLPAILHWEWLVAMHAKKDKLLPIKKIVLPQDTTVKMAAEYLGWDYFAAIDLGQGRYVFEADLLDEFGGI